MERQVREIQTKFETRDENNAPHIAGYFVVFGATYEIAPGMTESIAPGAFSNALGDDIRALTNHDTRLVLGRNTAGTLELREDAHGLWGDIVVNPKDSDAMNTYARCERGDVTQASFGFDIVREDSEVRPDGSVHWTIREVKLYEVSVCTFPAYRDTNISAREADRDSIKARRLEAWKMRMKELIKHDPSADA